MKLYVILIIFIPTLNSFAQPASNKGYTLNFSQLDEFIDGKEIVLIGELLHNSVENEQPIFEIVKYLHEKHGFDLVCSETAFDQLQRQLYLEHPLSIDSGIRNVEDKTIFKTSWLYYEYKLIEYWHEMKATNKQFDFLGIDIETGHLNSRVAFDLFEDYLIRRNLSSHVVDYRYKSLVDDFMSIRVGRPNSEELRLQGKENIVNFLSFLNDLRSIIPIDGKMDSMNFWINFLDNVCIGYQYGRFYEDFKINEDKSAWNLRDSMMAQNIEFIKGFNPNRKVIVLASNFHIIKNSGKFKSNQFNINAARPLGVILNEKYGNKCLHIGTASYKVNLNAKYKAKKCKCRKTSVEFIISKGTSPRIVTWKEISREGERLCSNSLSGYNYKTEWEEIYDLLLFVRELNQQHTRSLSEWRVWENDQIE